MGRAALLASVLAFPTAAFSQATQADSEPKARTTLDAGLEIGTGYTDNVFATRNFERSDFLFVARPTFQLTREKGDNRISVHAEGELGRYADHKSENYNDWLIGVDARLHAARGFVLLGGADYRWAHESRESPEAQNGSEPTRYRLLHAYGGAIIGSGPLTFRPAIIVDRYDYKDVPANGSTINNDDRDRTEVEVGGRLLQRVSEETQVFVQGAWNSRDYRQQVDDAGFRRDSTGGSVNVGIRRVFSPELTVEAFAGYLKQRFRDPRLKDVGATDFGATVDWTGPKGLGVSFRLDRSVGETTLPGASSYLLTNGSVTLKASPHPRFDAGLTLGGSLYNYRGNPRTEFVTSTDLWLRHWLTRNIFAEIDYKLAQRTSNAAGFSFEENRAFLTLGAQLKPHYLGSPAALRFGETVPGGAYVGVFAGHGALTTGLDGPRGQGFNTAEFGDTGAGYGAFTGYGVTIGNVYVGAEVEGGLDGPRWNHRAERVFSIEKNATAGITARLGWLTPSRDLVYGRFGVSLSKLRTRYELFDNKTDSSNWRTGLDFGAGAEAGVGKRAFVRAEYVLTSYHDVDVATGKGDDNLSTSEGQFRIGAGYRFGALADEKAVQPTRFGGFYAGAEVGHGALVSRNQGVREKSQTVDISRGGHGASIGVFAGYGIAWNQLYLGVEGEADTSRIEWNLERDPNGRVYSARRQRSFGGGIRAGWLISKSALLYGRVGAARTRFIIPYATTKLSVLSEKSKTGLRVGGGLEVGLGSRDRLRFDYTVTRYGAYDVNYGENSDRFKHDDNVMRLGLAHAF
jgi:hypothetical protein